ncbi:MAG: hypothetical protein ACREFB_03310, partial [Stellaceae bacterium]
AQRLGAAPYVIGGLSFIPLVGVLFGVAAIVWAIVTRKAGRVKLALIGTGGIACTVLLYGALIYFGFLQRGGMYDNLRVRMAQSELYTLVEAIEFYNLQYGHYPESLMKLQSTFPAGSFVTIYDPTDFSFTRAPRYFYYRRIGSDHYYLRGVGPDGRAFTVDDIVPAIMIAPTSRIGLLLAPPAGTAPAPTKP